MCFLVLILAVRLLISCVTYPHSAAGRVHCKYEVLRRLVLHVDATARRIGTVMRAGSLSVLLLVLAALLLIPLALLLGLFLLLLLLILAVLLIILCVLRVLVVEP